MRNCLCRARDSVEDAIEHVLVEPVRRPGNGVRDRSHDDLLVERIEVVLVPQHLVATAEDDVAFGEPHESTIATGVVLNAEQPTGDQAEGHDDEGERRLRPLELGVAELRRTADPVLRGLGAARRVVVAFLVSVDF
ncbi:MAG: hypothetical protein ACK55Z_35710, partial [bacterium]